MVGVYSRDRTVPDSYRLFSYPDYVGPSGLTASFESVMAQTYTMAASPAGDGTRRLLAAVISSNYFDTLGVTLAAGRPFTADEERPGARVPCRDRDVRPPGRRPVRSRVHRADDHASTRDDYTIVGVTPEGFSGTMALLSPEVFLPLGMFDAVVDDRFKNNGRGLGDRSNVGLSVAGRLAPGVTMEGAARAARRAVAAARSGVSRGPPEPGVEHCSRLSRLAVSTGRRTTRRWRRSPGSC